MGECCERREPGAVLKAAAERAKSVEAGRMVMTVFSAGDAGELMGMEGASYILKLPESAPENCRCHFAARNFENGEAAEPIDYGSEFADWYIESTRCWLIDVAVTRNSFAENPISFDAVFMLRASSIDALDSGRQDHRGRYRPREGKDVDPEELALFLHSGDRSVGIATDIPLGVWYVHSDKAHEIDPFGPVEVACASRRACVFYVRFQEENPGRQEEKRCSER